MTAPVSPIVLNGAASQADRVADAPDPGAVVIDGRGVADILALAGRYADLVRFWDGDDREAGTWAPFFTADPAAALALHVATDLDAAERRLAVIIRRLRDRDGSIAADLRAFVAVVDRLIAIHDREAPADAPEAGSLDRRRGERRHDPIGETLHRVHAHAPAGWLDAIEDGEAWAADWFAALVDLLEDLGITAVNALREGQDDARAALDRRLAEGGHAPHAALIAAFAEALVAANGALNRFPARLADFYHDEVLRQAPRPAAPDRVYLAFTRADPDRVASVPRGAAFAAGTDASGAAITYVAETALDVLPTAVTALSVHRLDPDATAVLSGEVAVDPAAPGALTPFPIFGSDSVGTWGPLTMSDATQAFSVVSPTLMLTGGARHVAIGLQVAPVAGAHEPATGREALVADAARVLGTAFDLYFSTAGGWVLVEGFGVATTILPGDEGTVYTLSFDLPADAPPLVATGAAAAPGAPPPTFAADHFPVSTTQPAILAQLKSGRGAATGWARVNALAIAGHLTIGRIRIDVAVTGLTRLSVRTPTGSADPTADFLPFGVPPRRGAGFSIAAEELFVKTPTAVAVTLGWSGLPATSTGFAGYYGGYALDPDGQVAPRPLFDNTSFRVAAAMTNPGLWTVDPTPIALFDTVAGTPGQPAPAAPLAPVTRLAATITPIAAPAPYYEPGASRLGFTLVSPAYAFGDTLYASNIHRAVQAQTRLAPPGAGTGSAGRIAALARVNMAAPDRDRAGLVANGVEQAVVSLSHEAADALRTAIALGATGPAGDALLADLEATVAMVAAGPGPSIWRRLLRPPPATDLAAMPTALARWLETHGGAIGKEAGAAIGVARERLATATALVDAHAVAAGQPADAARATVADVLGTAAARATALPNAPWLPTVASLSVDYRASATILPTGGADAAANGVEGVEAAGSFLQLAPFNVVTAPRPDEIVSLLAPVDTQPALFIKLAHPRRTVSLLFVLAAGTDGWWSDPPELCWEQHGPGGWSPVELLDDGTDGLRSSGIVTLGLDTGPHGRKSMRLRVRLAGTAERVPAVLAVVANALVARWAGPGGAATRGVQPLPAGSISASSGTLANIGSIVQPMQSFGGRGPLAGRDLSRWLAERLRHKGYATDPWDFAHLILAEEPTVWQAAVVPATDARTGGPAPGAVWLVVVGGAATPNVTDTTVPRVDSATLARIGERLAARTTPFADIAVTNPPYARLRVTVDCVFTADDTAAHWTEQLDAELRSWLSPWPPAAALGPRPRDYHGVQAIAAFVRSRPYVLGVSACTVAPEGQVPLQCYYTSAHRHRVTGRVDAAGAARLAG